MGKPMYKELPPDLRRVRDGVKPKTPAWAQWVREIEEYLGYRICGRINRKGFPCCQKPLQGRDACKFHGGRALRGPANPGWKTGRASMFADLLPERFEHSFRTLMEDPKLLALETDIALADLRLLELVRTWRDGTDPVEACQQAENYVGDLRVALAEGDTEEAGATLDQLAAALHAGAVARDVWDQIGAIQERKRKLTETEGKRLERMQAFITAEEARAYNQMVIAVITTAAEQVLPRELGRLYLSRVYEGITRIMQKQPARELDKRQLPSHLQVNDEE